MLKMLTGILMIYVRVLMCVLLQGYGSTFIKQYVMDSGAGGDMNVGEFWADLHWEDGGEQLLPVSVWIWVQVDFFYRPGFLRQLYALQV
jgi:hypothetical protein